MWQLLRSLRYRQPRPAIRVPRQILGSQKRKIPNVEAGSMDGFVCIVPSLMKWRLSLLHGRLLLFLKLFQMYPSVSYHSCILACWGSPCQKGRRA
ncbi:hypothetical protein NC653_005454 [Populus alba x Populus x berolinensis]|uniref:Uncharacterized protein n=1 Tax=Populus alba x Populus x berolinensis TaxID=444605 RepID=A0AAD6RC93_9ROSI|nr:hypothetical protein NC653_005454 [Populus alba x Populus x berolinensis]